VHTIATLLAIAAFGAGAPAHTAPAGPLAGKVITVDPGHNGGNGSHPSEINQQVSIGNGETKECDTAGTQTPSGYAEHAYTFNVAKRLKRLLKAAGAKVVLTRKNDTGVGPCISERAAIGNRAHSDAAVSIHADGGPSSGRGFHVIYSTKIDGLTDDIYEPSKKLAVTLRDAYENVTGMPEATYIGSNGLDERSDLGGLRLSDVPKVFIETGNMQNGTDANKLESRSFRQKIAAGIFAGIKRYLR
jgi:N-acetylmuramoyl-L-alanine amidase